MAPEQLEGKPADARADIYGLGAVLYEMITGHRAFDGVQPLEPPLLEQVVQTCLARDPGERWQSVRDLIRPLTWLRDGAIATSEAPATAARRNGLRTGVLAGAAVATVLFGAVMLYESLQGGETPGARVSFSIFPPDGTRFPRGAAHLAISPDGGRLAFVAVGSDGASRLWVRDFNILTPRLLPGTEGAQLPFWSPDGRFIGFFADGKLKRIDAMGGAAYVLCPSSVFEGGTGGTWNRDGVILFSGFGSSIRRVPATGGDPVPVTTLDTSRRELAHIAPVFLPDGRRFLYVAVSENRDQSAIYQGTLDSAQVRRVLPAESPAAVAAPTSCISATIRLSRSVMTPIVGTRRPRPSRLPTGSIPIVRCGGGTVRGLRFGARLSQRKPRQPPGLVRSCRHPDGGVSHRRRLPASFPVAGR